MKGKNETKWKVKWGEIKGKRKENEAKGETESKGETEMER